MGLRLFATAVVSLLALGIGVPVLQAAAPAWPEVAAGSPARVAAVSPPMPGDVPLADLVRVDERARGRSGAVRVSVVNVMERLDRLFLVEEAGVEGVTYRWLPLFGTAPDALGGSARLDAGLHAPSQPGFWRLLLSRHAEQHEVDALTVVTKIPFAAKRAGRINGYLIGSYPTEGRGRVDEYAPPIGFIEVTAENQHVQVSRHLRLGQFVTKNQFDVWPKYVALDLRLIDKLELVMQELHAMGVRAERLHIMSGFRTPHYNGPGGSGRARLSRHTYGDAADIWVENGARTGYIADLNGDGRQDIRDAEVLLQAVERVEQMFPELVGGAGVYLESGARGPFVHVDVRGVRSRW